jgi:hypothetical protein
MPGNDTQSANSTFSKPNYSTFQDSTLGLSLKYPTNWTILESTGNETFMIENKQGGQFEIVVANSSEFT